MFLALTSIVLLGAKKNDLYVLFVILIRNDNSHLGLRRGVVSLFVNSRLEVYYRETIKGF